MHHLEELRKLCNGQWLSQPHEKNIIQQLSIDSRKITDPERTLFIALKTDRRSGHQFIRTAYESGVRSFLVSEPVPTTDLEEAAFILVPDTLQALQLIAARHRKQFHMPVIGITGSNGKTIVKEWLYQLLAEEMRVVRSPKSFNSQIGVPLSVWLLDKKYDVGIFEAGISQPGEMEKLESVIRPTIGLFTNIGEAHSEGFLNQRQKINEKLLFFRHAKHLVYCSDHADLRECIPQYLKALKTGGSDEALKTFTWSARAGDANLIITGVKKSGNRSEISGVYNGKEETITIPFTDAASVENAIHCWAVIMVMGLENKIPLDSFKELQPVAMRLELKHGINNTTVINDTYNSDLTSFGIALDYLSQQKQHSRKTVVLSDMAQIALSDNDLYEKVAALIVAKKVERFIGIGNSLFKHKDLFSKYPKLESHFYKTTAEFLKQFHLLSFEHEAVLLKGARSFAFEKISLLLEDETHQTILSIDLGALQHNLNVFRKVAGKRVQIMAMVKAFSYGAGSYEIAQALQYAGVDYLSVAYTDEGVDLRRAGITLPIMVMSPDAVAFDRMIAWKLEPEIFNFRTLELFTQMAANLGVENFPVHIKLDTGMHRLGFVHTEIPGLIAQLKENKQVKVASIFSHLAASEDPALDFFTENQAALFDTMSAELLQALDYKPFRHLCNTAGIARHPELHYDMVRLGLGLYGIDSSGKVQKELQQIGTLRTTIAQIKEIEAGETIGYSRAGVATETMRIATVSIGYADGYPRALGNGHAYMLVHGKKAPTVGIICMDMCMIDITQIPEAKEGDEVLIFGKELPVTSLSSLAGTIPYELMTGISQRVKRVYVNEG